MTFTKVKKSSSLTCAWDRPPFKSTFLPYPNNFNMLLPTRRIFKAS